MKQVRRKIALLLLPVLLGLLGGPARAATVSPVSTSLRMQLGQAGSGDRIPVIVRMEEPARVQSLAVPPGAKGQVRAQARENLVRTLRARAEDSRRPLREVLRRHGITAPKDLWLINGLAFSAAPELIAELESLPGVASIVYDRIIHPPRVVPAADTDPANLVEDNIDLVGAPTLWSEGFRGSGMTVAIVDTGVDVDHPDLSPGWRGGGNSWFNAVAANCDDLQVDCLTTCDTNTTEPCDYIDAEGVAHGTGVAGVAVGGSAGGTAIGVAPEAQWIAVKVFDSSDSAPASVIHAGFQWLLDPDGNPATDDAPDVVNASWGFEGSEDLCLREFQPEVTALKNAGIAVAFSAGNIASATGGTSISPANYPESFAVGSVGTPTSRTEISDFSARGPSACDGSIYPEVVAPGFEIRTADFSTGGLDPNPYRTISGTSFSAPHAAGVMALLLEAFPGLPVPELENVLEQTAVDLGLGGPDNVYGFGLVDAVAAFDFLAGLEPNLQLTDSVVPQTDGLLGFGHVPPGQSATETVQVRNGGSADLTLETVDTAGVMAPFSVAEDLCSNRVLAPTETCTLTLRFAPTDLGSFSASLAVVSDDPDQPRATVVLSGTGNTPPAAPKPQAPADGATVGTEVTFSWLPASDGDGDGVDQTLIVAPHEDFTAADTFPVDPVLPMTLGAAGLVAVALTVRRRRVAVVLLAAALGLALHACSGGGDSTFRLPDEAQSTTRPGFQSGVTYYWKMRAEDSRGAVTESAVRRFVVE